MFEQFRNTFLVLVLIGLVAFFGYRNEQNTAALLKAAISETFAEEKKRQDQSTSMMKEIEPCPTVSAEAEEQKVESIINAYIHKNPDIILKALQQIEQDKADLAKKQIADNLIAKKSDLESAGSPFLGNPEGKSIVVMFFDYHCGYCRESFAAINAVTKSHPDVKVILKMYPVLGQDSETLARLALATFLTHPDKFETLNTEILSEKSFVKRDLDQYFKSIGINPEVINNVASSEEVSKMLAANMALARDLRVSGVPVFVINGELHPGYLTEEIMNQYLASSTQHAEAPEAIVPHSAVEHVHQHDIAHGPEHEKYHDQEHENEHENDHGNQQGNKQGALVFWKTTQCLTCEFKFIH